MMRDGLGWPLPQNIGTSGEHRDAFPELARRGQWVCLNIHPSIPWPVLPQAVMFADQEIWIIPLTQDEHPGVAVDRTPDMTVDDAEGILYRLLSVISWRENAGLEVAHRTGGSWLRMVGIDTKRGYATRQPFDFTEMICPVERSPRIALGLMREGRSLNHSGYAFLSFWRVIELAFPKSAERVSWMQDTLPTLRGQGVAEGLEAVRAEGVDDVCKHLFASGRCAIAHARGGPIVNPDDPRDARRLAREMPLVRELAVRAIEDRLGIDSSSKEYREHLYELQGWKRAIGGQMIAHIISGEEIPEDDVIDLPVISLRLRAKPPYSALDVMIPNEARAEEGKLFLEYQSPDRLAAIRFVLDFAGERLLLDVERGLLVHDDGSVEAARHRVDMRRFFRDMLLNGELQMWDVQSGKLISRLDPLIPLNCSLDLNACNSFIDEAQADVDQRRDIAENGRG